MDIRKGSQLFYNTAFYITRQIVKYVNSDLFQSQKVRDKHKEHASHTIVGGQH